jgi:hypothetical protein
MRGIASSPISVGNNLQMPGVSYDPPICYISVIISPYSQSKLEVCRERLEGSRKIIII